MPGRDGAAIQTAAGGRLVRPRHMVMFRFIEGIEPDETMDLARPFVRLGEISARLHEHVLHWQRPAGFERLVWDADHIFLPGANWGDWRAAPAMDAPTRAVLERLERAVRRRLAAFGKAPTRFNLIHADIRLANLLIEEGSTRVIDFDDCGFGWFLYDVATTVSFVEDHPKVPEWIAAWCEGYRRVRPLPAADEAEIPTFVLMRRMALLAWIGSHAETDLAKAQGPAFTRVSADLAEDYLARFA
jgi:Ser/Thr protein kinase RdoA (MazF antagonist)